MKKINFRIEEKPKGTREATRARGKKVLLPHEKIFTSFERVFMFLVEKVCSGQLKKGQKEIFDYKNFHFTFVSVFFLSFGFGGNYF